MSPSTRAMTVGHHEPWSSKRARCAHHEGLVPGAAAILLAGRRCQALAMPGEEDEHAMYQSQL